MTDLEALAEQMTAEQYKRWGLEEPHDDLRGPTWDKVRRAKENALKDLTDLGYSIAGPDEMITPKKSITPIEEAFKDFDIAGPDEVVVPREPEETLIQAMYDANDTADAPLEDWLECLRRAYRAMIAAAQGGKG